jgi:uncharacterized protein YlbG (UPF0298 family)
MVKYTKYGKHRYQAFIFNDDKVIKTITKNIGNNNYFEHIDQCYIKYLGFKYPHDTTSNEKYRINNSGYHLIYSKENLHKIKVITIDMLQLDILPDYILEKTNIIALNRDMILDDLIE